MVTNRDQPENDDNDDVVIKHDPELVKRRTDEIAKKEKTEPAKQDTGGLVKKITGEFAKKITQPLQESAFSLEEYAFLAVLVLVILAPVFLPVHLNDTQVALFVVAPVMAWFVRLVYEGEKRRNR